MSLDPVRRLQAKLQNKTQNEVAAEIGISPQYLCDILKRRREPGSAVLAYLGIERRVTYRIKE